MSTHFTTIETSEKPISRDWLAAGLVAVGFGLVTMAAAVSFGAWSLIVMSSKKCQQAMTTQLYDNCSPDVRGRFNRAIEELSKVWGS